MSSFSLKIIAIIAITLDYWNVILGGPIYMRILGRLSFPIFSFLIGEGYRHTKNKKKYFVKIFLYSILLQMPVYFFYSKEEKLNIFFTLASGILLLSILENNKMSNVIKYFCALILLIISEYLKFDYGSYGIISIFIFYKFKEKKMLISFLFLLVNIVYIVSGKIFSIQIFSLFSLIFIFKYNGKEGKKNKQFFYLYYPTHILLLYLLSKFIFDT